MWFTDQTFSAKKFLIIPFFGTVTDAITVGLNNFEKVPVFREKSWKYFQIKNVVKFWGISWHFQAEIYV
jgi:hypothetical protein